MEDSENDGDLHGFGGTYSSRPRGNFLGYAHYKELRKLGFKRAKGSKLLPFTPSEMVLSVEGHYETVRLKATLVRKRSRSYRVRVVNGATPSEIAEARNNIGLDRRIAGFTAPLDEEGLLLI